MMKKINAYITEKLDLNKAKKKEESFYENIYGVHEGDKVLVYKHHRIGMTHPADYKIELFVGEITSIKDDKLYVKSLEDNTELPEFSFFDHTKSTKPVSDCFAWHYEQKPGWLAIMKKDTAIKVINKSFSLPSNRTRINWIGPHKIWGTGKRKLLEDILKELEEN